MNFDQNRFSIRRSKKSLFGRRVGSRSTYSLNFLKKCSFKSRYSGASGRSAYSNITRGGDEFNVRPRRNATTTSLRMAFDSSDDSDFFTSTEDSEESDEDVEDDDDNSSGTLAAAQSDQVLVHTGRGRPKKNVTNCDNLAILSNVDLRKSKVDSSKEKLSNSKLSTSHFDSDNDEIPEMATVDDQNRNLFEQIQKDVQSVGLFYLILDLLNIVCFIGFK